MPLVLWYRLLSLGRVDSFCCFLTASGLRVCGCLGSAFCILILTLSNFCFVTWLYPLSNFRSKTWKWPKNIKTRLLYPFVAPYNTKEGHHRRISVDPENRNVRHTKKCYDTFIHWLSFFPDLQGRFGWFVNLLLSLFWNSSKYERIWSREKKAHVNFARNACPP